MKRKVKLESLEEGDAFEYDGSWWIVSDEFDEDNGNRLVVNVETGMLFRHEPSIMVEPKTIYFCEDE